MPGKQKHSPVRGETITGAPAPAAHESAEEQVRLELTDKLAVAAGPPTPISFKGVPYSVRRGYTPDEVLEFFDLSRARRYDQILSLLICEGDPELLWEALGERSMPELINVYLPNIYKAAGLMNAQGEFLAL